MIFATCTSSRSGSCSSQLYIVGLSILLQTISWLAGGQCKSVPPFKGTCVEIQTRVDESQKIVFRDSASSRIIFSTDEIGFHVSYGVFRTRKENLFYTFYFSGGESGGSLQMNFYKIRKDSVIKIPVDVGVSGYTDLLHFDIDGDGIDEIESVSGIYYGRTLWECLGASSVYVAGVSEITFPRIFHLSSNDEHNFIFDEVTFQRKFRHRWRPSVLKVESLLNEYKAKNLEIIYWYEIIFIIPILDYYYYKTKIGEEKNAFRKIKAANISITYDCGSPTTRIQLTDLIRESKKLDPRVDNNIGF